ncbi:acyltransferase [Algoriphagus sp.]|uniref:acyltransferase n=1 Tax=Algoriphagus sp. TaxID=1872435 RepID=UPI00391AF1E7
MQQAIILFFKGLRILIRNLLQPIDYIMSYIIFYINGVHFSTFKNQGWPRVNVGSGGKCVIGYGFRSNNREMSNPIGRFNRCSIVVGNRGSLIIGNNVGISSTAIVCHHHIEIGDNVKIGGNVVIYDTDFHSLNLESRIDSKTDKEETIRAPVKIGKYAFIGGHSTILKGVEIGDNAIVGACSVVTKNIPENEIWAGNPIRFVRKNNL